MNTVGGPREPLAERELFPFCVDIRCSRGADRGIGVLKPFLWVGLPKDLPLPFVAGMITEGNAAAVSKPSEIDISSSRRGVGVAESSRDGVSSRC